MVDLRGCSGESCVVYPRSTQVKHYMFNFTTVVFDGTSPTFYFTNTSGWNTSSSNVFVVPDKTGHNYLRS